MSPQARKKSVQGKRKRKAAKKRSVTKPKKDTKRTGASEEITVTVPSISKYHPKYCQMIVDERAKGISEMGFAGLIGVIWGTLDQWSKTYPEFATARELAQCAARLFYDRIGVAGITGRLEKFNPTAWIWVGKNCFGMSDKVAQHNTYGL